MLTASFVSPAFLPPSAPHRSLLFRGSAQSKLQVSSVQLRCRKPALYSCQRVFSSTAGLARQEDSGLALWVETSQNAGAVEGRIAPGIASAVKKSWSRPFTLRPLTRLVTRAVNRGVGFQPVSAGLQGSSDGQLARTSNNNDNGMVVSRLELDRGTPPEKKKAVFNGVFLLILVNLAMYVADHLLHISTVKWLYLYHLHPRWYQFLTATFCHAGWSHLSGNLFFVYIFGKLVEEEEGALGVWATYLITGVGANLFSWLLLPSSAVSVGASGAVFGLFAVSVLVKISFNWRKLLEVLILGQFVIEKVISEAKASASMPGHHMGNSSINHVAHLAGALLGVGLIWLLSRIPGGDDPPDSPSGFIQIR